MTVNVRAGFAQPVVQYAETVPTFYSGTATTAGAEIVPANVNRKMGVFVQNVDTTHGTSARLNVGSVSGDALILLERFGATSNGLNATMIYGTGAVFIKATITTTDYACWEY